MTTRMKMEKSPKWSQDGPGWAPDAPETRDCPKMDQDAPKMLPGCSQDASKSPEMLQNSPTRVPRWANMVIDGPKTSPRWLQIVPGSPGAMLARLNRHCFHRCFSPRNCMPVLRSQEQRNMETTFIPIPTKSFGQPPDIFTPQPFPDTTHLPVPAAMKPTDLWHTPAAED